MQQIWRDSPPRLIYQSVCRTEGTPLLSVALQAFHRFRRLCAHRQRQTLKKQEKKKSQEQSTERFFPAREQHGHESKAASFRHYPEQNFVRPETAIKLKSSDFQKQGTQNLPTPEKLTVRRRTQPAKDVHQRRLPGPAVPEQSRDLTFIDVEG